MVFVNGIDDTKLSASSVATFTNKTIDASVQANGNVIKLGTDNNDVGTGNQSTASAVLVQAGFGFAYTPKSSGRIIIFVTCTVSNSGVGDGGGAIISFGTGTAPVNGAAATGTTLGTAQNFLSTAANANSVMTLVGIATGLTVGTALWIDLQIAATVAGTASFNGPNCNVIEI